MSQNVVDFSDDPSGVELLDDKLTPFKENVLTSNSGTSRPSYAQAGTVWNDTTTTPWIRKMFDGTDDIILGYVNATTNLFTPAGLRLDNIAATTAPTVNEDSADGYSVGSVWINVTTDIAYINVDASVGAAVWKKSTITPVANSDLATMAANTIKANNTGSSAVPSDVALAVSQLFGRGSSGNLAAITLGAGLSMSSTTLSSSGIQSVHVQTFTSSGTYTPTTGMAYCLIIAVGGGGAGGGVGTSNGGAGGGGSGETAISIKTAADIGASKTVTIGAGGTGSGSSNGGNGGTTSVGSLVAASGGVGGSIANSGVGSLGGSGGSGSGTGDMLISGGNGASGLLAAGGGNQGLGGNGGASFFGGGGKGGYVQDADGGAGLAYGSGGGGAVTASATIRAGGNGKAGAVIVIEFCTQ